jgi:hypothetical protein
MAKHKGEKLPKWTRKNPSVGKHGSKDKAADRVGKQWEKERKDE